MSLEDSGQCPDSPFPHACRLKRRSKAGRRAAVGDDVALDLLRLPGFDWSIIMEITSVRHGTQAAAQ